MTELLEQAIETARRLSAAEQDYIAKAILALTESDLEPAEDINPAHLSGVMEGLAQAERGQFASDAEIEAAFRRFGE